MAELQFYWIGFDQTRKYVPNCSVLKLLNPNPSNWRPAVK